MLVRLRDPQNQTIVVNTDHVVLVVPLHDKQNFPVVGQSLVHIGQGINLAVSGTPEEIYGMLRRPEAAPNGAILPK